MLNTHTIRSISVTLTTLTFTRHGSNNKGYSALGLVWQEPEPSQATGMAPIRCILGKFLGVVCHCFPPPFRRTVHVLNDARDPSSERWKYGREMSGNFAYMTFT